VIYKKLIYKKLFFFAFDLPANSSKKRCTALQLHDVVVLLLMMTEEAVNCNLLCNTVLGILTQIGKCQKY
jgi:hypothetical protein